MPPERDARASRSDGMSIGAHKDSSESGCLTSGPRLEGAALACPFEPPAR